MMMYNNNNNNNNNNNLNNNNLINNNNNIYKLRNWININNINWYNMSLNPHVISLLEENINNIDRVDWSLLSENPNAISEQNSDNIDWLNLSLDPSIFTYDYEKMKETKKNSGFSEELIKYVFNPNRLLTICNDYNIEFDELMNILD